MRSVERAPKVTLEARTELGEEIEETTPRIKTGIPGLDDLVEGGFISGSTLLLRGGSGAGKTIFGLQFLHYGALNREPGVLLSLEESANDLRREAARFGWDLKELERQRLLAIVEAKPWTEPSKHASATERLERIATEVGATRVVIDSVPALFQNYPSEVAASEGARAVAQLCWNLSEKVHATTLLITKMNSNGNSTAEEDICRGVIELRARLVQGVVRRYLLVKKMRETQHSNRLYVYDFTPRGLAVFNPTSSSWTSLTQAHGSLEVAEEFL